LAVLLYATALAINRHDSEPSPAAVRLSSLYRERPAVADADNAYVYFMGFHAPRDRDPFEVGRARVAWLRRTVDAPLTDSGVDPLPNASVTLPALADLVPHCADAGLYCAGALDVSAAAFDGWLAANGWWLDRYRALLERTAWQENVPTGWGGPFPAYVPVSQVQRALLFDVAVLAERGHAAEVKALLASDIRFWRTVLESSDASLSKIIAVGALRHHFEWGNLALRKFAPASAAAAIPDEWRTPFSDSERSLERVIASEWRSASARLDRYARDLAERSSAADRALLQPLYQRQDTLNRLADYYGGVYDLVETPLERYPAAVAQASQLTQSTRTQWVRPTLYNLVGSAVFYAGPSDLADYAARVADLEGIRRGALAAVTLRSEGVLPADLPAALRTKALRNPYDGEPLLWDERRGAIVFRGLEQGVRGEHRFYF
jgi:hypothetical protein